MKQRLFLLQSLWIFLGILLTLLFGLRKRSGPGPSWFRFTILRRQVFLIVVAWWASLEFVWLLLFSCFLIRSWGDVAFNLTMALIGFVVWFITHVLLDVESMQPGITLSP